MKTAKALGFKKGDLVRTEMGFPGVIIGEAHTRAPLLEVWGLEQEMGSAYAEELERIDRERFTLLAMQYGHAHLESTSEISRKALAL